MMNRCYHHGPTPATDNVPALPTREDCTPSTNRRGISVSRVNDHVSRSRLLGRGIINDRKDLCPSKHQDGKAVAGLMIFISILISPVTKA
ncbi:uncharacterized protein L3040_008505 [Drepanopeziza brunnea f. sp. 'multigermtubi']|uniref:uncharacterized protein n=1 Tax=Drepanopeziza brunnea f. sp. 'multigermtubi' TaxID=698441 RepID=UPI0023835508|nr:hypothetical protein L3040_008505 [Drepanopeziza brunnea f. sp. 'multigermtubi']